MASNEYSSRPPVPLQHRKEGYANVARWIALDNDSETFIYRKFNQLAARNLLYLQSEIIALENQLNELDETDAKSHDMDLKDAARTWETQVRQHENGQAQAQIRMDLILKVRSKLHEYHRTLLLQSEVAKLPQPNERVLCTYREWFKKPYPALGGQAKSFLDVPSDLVALHISPETDNLSLFLRRYWPVNEEMSRDGLSRIGRFDEKSISIAVLIISVLIAAFLLIGSIVGLYFVKNDTTKLALVALFTAVFALSIGLMTNARRAEIFAATAAYCAVLVVFVSGDISSSQNVPTSTSKV